MTSQTNLDKFNEFYKETYSNILRYIIIKCHNINDVNDIIQEVYLELWKIMNKKNIDNTNINTPAIIDTYIANSGLYCFRITIIISASKPIPIILITSVIFSSYSLLFGIDYKSNNVLTVLNNELIC